MPQLHAVVARLDKLRGVVCRLHKHGEPWTQLASLQRDQLGQRVEALGGRNIGAAWRELPPAQTLSAVREALTTGLAYRGRIQDPRRERLADQLFAGLDRERMRVLANYAHDAGEHEASALCSAPRRGGAERAETPVLDRATFERALLMVDPRHVVLLVREDED